jgi:hypothetical protein
MSLQAEAHWEPSLVAVKLPPCAACGTPNRVEASVNCIACGAVLPLPAERRHVEAVLTTGQRRWLRLASLATRLGRFFARLSGDR